MYVSDGLDHPCCIAIDPALLEPVAVGNRGFHHASRHVHHAYQRFTHQRFTHPCTALPFTATAELTVFPRRKAFPTPT
jgi:hypothetical protein